jgi:hypothetical protein
MAFLGTIPSTSNVVASAITGTISGTRLPTGSVLQVVNATKTDRFQSTSGTMVDITGLSASITPTNSSNKVLIMVSMLVSADTWDTAGMLVNLVRNSTNLGVGTSGTNLNATSGYNAWSSGAGNTYFNISPMIITFFDSPNTTSSTTYKLQGRNATNGYSFTINGRVGNGDWGFSSSITLMEIAA